MRGASHKYIKHMHDLEVLSPETGFRARSVIVFIRFGSTVNAIMHVCEIIPRLNPTLTQAKTRAVTMLSNRDLGHLKSFRDPPKGVLHIIRGRVRVRVGMKMMNLGLNHV